MKISRHEEKLVNSESLLYLMYVTDRWRISVEINNKQFAQQSEMLEVFYSQQTHRSIMLQIVQIISLQFDVPLYDEFYLVMEEMWVSPLWVHSDTRG